MPEFTFDPQTHTYFLDGAQIPGTTDVLKEMRIVDYSFINQDTLQRAAKFGTAAHRATELSDQGVLDLESLSPPLVPYLEAWKKFREDFGFMPELIEYRSFHPLHKYGFTLDRIGKFLKSTHKGRRATVDIKTGIILPGFAIQTAAYEGGYNANYPRKKSDLRMTVRLKDDGTYQIEVHENKSDFSTFLSCLQLYRYRKHHNIK